MNKHRPANPVLLNVMNAANSSIIKLLLYYDVFDHPLTKEEIMLNCNLNGEASGNPGILEEMAAKGLIYRLDGYYAVRYDPSIIDKRNKGNKMAAASLPRAIKMAKFISAFPFVCSVSLSGSLSKNYMDEKTDIDYFIIANPNRLWLARTILILYKRIFLLNSHKYFCLNYFIDSEHLEIEQKNFFTATELSTLIPVTGKNYIELFFEANSWVKQYFYRYPFRDIGTVEPENDSSLKKTLEWTLNHLFGNVMDILAMKLTIKFWKRKYIKDAKNLFDKSFKLKRYVAKYHPQNFQEMVLDLFEQKVKNYEKLKQLSLN
jgi:hypothetical protein